MPTSIGRRTVFGHRCSVVGATLGDLCEIGNASILMPGARLGNRVFPGEGTLVRSGMTLPDDAASCSAGAVVKQRSEFGLGVEIDGFPAKAIGRVEGHPPAPPWALAVDDLPAMTAQSGD